MNLHRPPPEPDVLGYGKTDVNLLFRSVVLSALFL